MSLSDFTDQQLHDQIAAEHERGLRGAYGFPGNRKEIIDFISAAEAELNSRSELKP